MEKQKVEKKGKIDFNVLIDKHLECEYKPKDIGRYYPSEIGSCMRKVWFSYKKPKETEVDLVRVFEAGNILHDFVVEVLRSEKTPEVELLESEFPFRMEISGFLVSGRVDDLILVKLSGRKVLIEVKSTSYLKYREEPMKGHVMQLQFYMHATKVHDGMLLYIEKNTLQTKWFDLRYDKKIVDDAIKRFKMLHKSLKSGKMPSAEAKVSGEEWMCRYCPYAEECSKVN